MKKMYEKQMLGFTLIEIMLVIVIISILLWASVGYIQQRTLQMRMDRTSLQMQQILNAGMAYYVTNGNWPANIEALSGYLPSTTMTNPWNQPYKVIPYSQTTTPPSLPVLFVSTSITQTGTNTGSAAAAANVIAGTLPLSYTTSDPGSDTNPPAKGSDCSDTSNSCYVVASVNIPGQELSNARAVNFAGLYKHGGCIPVPACPTDASGKVAMNPEVMVVPVSISGFYEAGNAFPITSFSAYATGSTKLDTSPPLCKGTTEGPRGGQDCNANPLSGGVQAAAYWRACAQVITQRGNPTWRGITWGADITLAAFTRCAPAGEPAGSTFDVYSN